MRSKKSFCFNEEKDAIDIVTNGFPDGTIDYIKMYTVSKYLKNIFGYGEVRLEQEIIRFCTAQDPNFNPVIEAPAIRKWVRSAINYDLRKTNSITISQKEIDFLKTIEIQKERKLLFVILILAKALKQGGTRRKPTNHKTSDKYYIHYNNFQSIIKLSGIRNIGEVDLAYILHKYKKEFLFYNAEKELIRVEYVDKDSESGVIIDNLDNAMGYYDAFFNKTNSKTNHCAECGRLLTKIYTTKKYCDECSEKKQLEKKRRWWNKNRAKGSN